MRSAVFALVASALTGIAGAAELKPATVDAWEKYLRTAEVAMQGRLDEGKTFLWTDESEQRRQLVRSGQLVVAPVVGDGMQSVPDGIIHHWIGAVFIPNATTRGLLAVVDDYGNYKNIYKPAVVNSRALGSNTAEQEFSMTWLHHVMFVNAAMLGRYRSHEFSVDARRGYSVADATQIQQIEHFGKPEERFLPPDTGAGFIWRLRSISRYEERDGGVYLEVEALVLSRDIPSSVSWMVTPVVNRLSINSLKATLRQTRQAVQTRGATMEPIAMRGRNQH